MAEVQANGPPAGFVGRPRHRLFMVFDDPEAVAGAVEWLEHEGYAGDDVWVLRGEEGLHALDATGRLEGVRGRVIRAVERAMSSDVLYLATLQEALEAGATVVAVAQADAAAADRLAVLLRPRAARDLAYFANWEFQPVASPAR